ncbi:MAG TPA: hypothetical protein VMN77_11580 [Nitrospiria bacterium]|nr:hypothetical protein [Nitrospiria bacterium]
MKKDYWLIGIAAAGGALVWIVLSGVSHHREAWDSELYFIYGIPVICVVAAVLAYVEPQQPWRWAVTPFAAQGVWMFLTQGLGSMFPIGLVVLGIFSIPALLTAALGASLGRRRANRAPS